MKGKRILYILSILLVAVTLSGCDNYEMPEVDKLPMVVEGWIEEGEAPVVIVTHAIDLTADSVKYDDIVEKWGRVSVFDGDEQYVLTGRLNKDFTPSFIFTTSRLKGKPGHTYRLLIETEEETVEAVSTLPDAPRLVGLEAIPVEGSDSLYCLRASVEGIEDEGYYKFFTKTDDVETRYFGALMGSFRGYEYVEGTGMKISRGKYSGYSDSNFEYYFKPGDFVTVKLYSMEKEIFDFWKTYDEHVFLSDNLFFSFDESCPTNIAGGRGYWAAYGCSVRGILIKERGTRDEVREF